jgi:hypothetical protein
MSARHARDHGKELGETSQRVADARAHASTSMTERSYIDRDRAEVAAVERGWRVLRAGADHSQPSRGSKPFSEIPRPVATYLSCEWPDSNRHGVTHWYRNPAET